MNRQDSAKAIIEDGCITIRIPVAFLDTIVEGGPLFTENGLGFKVTDLDAFAKDLLHELNREEEDGTTPIHRMFDSVIEKAIEQGAEGVEEVGHD